MDDNRSRRVRRRRGMTVAALLVAAWVVACSPTGRHRVLTFFFDGVPEPGRAPTAGDAPTASPGTAGSAALEPGKRAPAAKIYTHTPYRENRCGGCHDNTTGQLHKKPEEGLCMACHRALTRDRRFAHGPAAVNACLFCHHHHMSRYPNQLLDEIRATCLRCHQRSELTDGEHHATIDEQDCTNCHDPHGGDNRFFLKRVER